MPARVCAADTTAGASPERVPAADYSYPFTPAGYTVAQVVFAVQHLGMLTGLLGLLRVARSRLARAGLYAAIAGTVLLIACELFAISAADVAMDSARADLVNIAYSVPTILLGASLLVAGFGLAGRLRWVTLVLGGYVFVGLLPSLMASQVLGRIGIGVWMLLFAWLGVTLLRRTEP